MGTRIYTADEDWIDEKSVRMLVSLDMSQARYYSNKYNFEVANAPIMLYNIIINIKEIERW